MPFKSEKQRRFLWAEHPDIAKRWAHEYPNQKKLPMYAHKQQHDDSAQPAKNTEKNAGINISALTRRYVNNSTAQFYRPIHINISETNNKTADSKQERVDIPHSAVPVYAGEEREKGEITNKIPDEKNISTISKTDTERPGNAIHDLLTKLSFVLSPHLEQTAENMRAEREGRVAVRVPKNRGVKRYHVNNCNIAPPMGLAQAQPQQQPQNQQTIRPVGGGSHPQFNPINSFGGLSLSGAINGNAAFGAKNSPNSSKIAAIIKRANAKLAYDIAGRRQSTNVINIQPQQAQQSAWNNSFAGRATNALSPITQPITAAINWATGANKSPASYIASDNFMDQIAANKNARKAWQDRLKNTPPVNNAQTRAIDAFVQRQQDPFQPVNPQPDPNIVAESQKAMKQYGVKPLPEPGTTTYTLTEEDRANMQRHMRDLQAQSQQPQQQKPPQTNAVIPPKPPAPSINTGAMPPKPIPIKRACRSETLGKVTNISTTDPDDIAYLDEEYEEELAGYNRRRT